MAITYSGGQSHIEFESNTNKGTTDAFLRQRVSMPSTIFDSKQIVDNSPLFWDDAQVSGSGTTSTYSSYRASSVLAVGATTAGRRTRQTFRRFNYQPGKSQEILMTAVLGAGGTGITKRVGYFDDNNGLFFQLSGSTLSVVVRSNVSGTPVDTVTNQSSWNIDKLDGTTTSGIEINVSNAQIFFIDFEWLGVGSVRFGFVIDGNLYYCHSALHANMISSVYMSTPNLPLRYEIINDGTGAAASLESICSTVISEGGEDRLGIIRSFNRGSTHFAAAATTNMYPLVSIRLKSTHLGVSVIPQAVSMYISTNDNVLWSLVMNPTVAGTDAASWTSATNSAIEYDISRTKVNYLTGGTIIYSGYTSIDLQSVSFQIEEPLLLGAKIDGTRDQLILAVQNTSSSAFNAFGALTVRELL